MNLTWIDKLFGGAAVAGNKTEIAGATLGILNGLNFILSSLGVVTFSAGTISTINMILAALLGIFLASRVTRTQQEVAAVNARIPVTVVGQTSAPVPQGPSDKPDPAA